LTTCPAATRSSPQGSSLPPATSERRRRATSPPVTPSRATARTSSGTAAAATRCRRTPAARASRPGSAEHLSVEASHGAAPPRPYNQGVLSEPLTSEQTEIRDLVRTLARERIAPRAAEIDKSADFPLDMVDLFREHELFGLPFDDEYGGTGTGALMVLVAVEEISKVCATTGLILAVQ